MRDEETGTGIYTFFFVLAARVFNPPFFFFTKKDSATVLLGGYFNYFGTCRCTELSMKLRVSAARSKTIKLNLKKKGGRGQWEGSLNIRIRKFLS